jgi:hypothetical protein
MVRRSRVRRLLKWGGLTASALVLLAFLISLLATVGWLRVQPTDRGSDFTGVFLGEGRLAFISQSVTREFMADRDAQSWQSGWQARSHGTRALRNALRYAGRRFEYQNGSAPGTSYRGLTIPLWFPFILSIVPAIIVLYGDRRYRLRHCANCGHDLNGIASGVCPECGQRRVEAKPGRFLRARKRTRFQQRMKWVGTVLSCLVVLATGVSAVYQDYWAFEYPNRGEKCLGSVSLLPGAIVVSGTDIPHSYEGRPACSKWYSRRLAWTWRPRLYRSPSGTFVYREALIPFWLIFLVVGVPTAFLWYRNRRFPAGCCPRCGYDLTANESGRCPECGESSQ